MPRIEPAVKTYYLVRGGIRRADVVELSNGKVVVSWLPNPELATKPSVIIYDSLDDAKAVHVTHMGGRGEPTEFVRSQSARPVHCTHVFPAHPNIEPAGDQPCGWKGFDVDAEAHDTGAWYCPRCNHAAVVVYSPPGT